MTTVIPTQVAYKCDVCNRKIRLTESPAGITTMKHCVITAGCNGSLRRDPNQKEVYKVPVIPPDVAGVQDWFQRKRLATHHQDVKSLVWTVNHDLGVVPTVHVYVERQVGDNTELVSVTPAHVTTVSTQTIELTFDRPESGVAQCTSQTSARRSEVSTVTQQTPTIQLTSAGTLTFATLDASPHFGLSLKFASNTSEIVIDYNSVGIGATLSSPWSGVRKIYVDGKTYSVRELNIISTYPAPEWFSTNRIVSGMTVAPMNIKASKQVLFLTGRSPFKVTDRITDSYVDAIHMATSEQFTAFYTDGNIFCSDGIVTKTYPHIFSVG